jgi:hypothetical protein
MIKLSDNHLDPNGYWNQPIAKMIFKPTVDDDGWKHPDKFQLTMGYNQAIPYHHEVIKHLLDRIEQLERTVAELKSGK